MRASTRLCRHCLAQFRAKSPPANSANRRIPALQVQCQRSQHSRASPTPGVNAPRSHNITRSASRSISFDTNAQQNSPPASNDFYITSLGHASPDTSRELLKEDNLFHPYSSSPSPEIRRRAAFIKMQAYCPHPSHARTRQASSPTDLENRKPEPGSAEAQTASPPAHVKFECPDCGIPVACCQEHWEDDYKSHLEICDTLRQINEDDHDLRSGRVFPEFEYPLNQRAEEFVINMSNWDTFFYTRDFKAMDDMRSMRHVSKVMSYPTTITSVLHELSPYNIRAGGRMTPEGLRSFSALRYTLHPPKQGADETMKGLKPAPPPIRIFILGARAESSIPRDVWTQIFYCFPRSSFHIILIGPEAMANRDNEFPLPPRTPANPFGGIVEDRLGVNMKITTYVDYFQTMHEAQMFVPYDPYFDVFMLFHPGLGHPASSHEWEAAIPQLLETKCPIICTGYTEWDMNRDLEYVKETVGGEMDILLEPGENIFRSLRWDINDMDPSEVTCSNWGVWAFRGKRYEATHKDE